MTDSNGLVYLNARYYNPGDGQFLSSDPMAGQPANPGTFNLYGYVMGNPIIGTDPSGKMAIYDSQDGSSDQDWVQSMSNSWDTNTTGDGTSGVTLQLNPTGTGGSLSQGQIQAVGYAYRYNASKPSNPAYPVDNILNKRCR